MQLLDRIEQRRFVGRELLLWLWYTSETSEGTLQVPAIGEVGLWLAKQLVLSFGKESTRIKAPMPGATREAKEALLAGKLPESAGIQVTWNEQSFAFTIKAETLSLSGLALPTVLDREEEEPAPLLAPPPRRKKKAVQEDASDEAHEAFYERMRLTREIESLIEALYAQFLALRLGPEWESEVVPAMRDWARG